MEPGDEHVETGVGGREQARKQDLARDAPGAALRPARILDRPADPDLGEEGTAGGRTVGDGGRRRAQIRRRDRGCKEQGEQNAERGAHDGILAASDSAALHAEPAPVSQGALLDRRESQAVYLFRNNDGSKTVRTL